MKRALQREDLARQTDVCRKYDLEPSPVAEGTKIGVSKDLRDGADPVHGLRHRPEGDTNGWYIWTGDYTEADDFFVPLHVEHLAEWRPEVIDFLALPPGSRFLIGAGGYEDVWFDENLLDV